jgi:hemerythrin-like domain-containing protein
MRRNEMMELQRHISRKLHEEHVHVLGLLGRFENALLALRDGPPPAGDAAWSRLLGEVAGALDYEITRHFDLEEDQLFPRLHASGQGDLAELLFEEHEAIRAVARQLIALLGRARAGERDAALWRALKVSGLELVERLGAHARKEEDSLVPAVDELLDAATDDELFAAYAMS